MARFFGKFSLDYCDLPTLFCNVGVLLRVLTVNINRNYTQPISCIWYFTAIFSGVCYSYSYIFSTVWFVLVKCPETGDFTSAMVALSLTTCSITAIPKICYMKYYRGDVESNFYFTKESSACYINMGPPESLKTIFKDAAILTLPLLYIVENIIQTVMNIVDDYLQCNELVVKGTRFEANILKVLRIIKKQGATAWTVLIVNAAIYASVPFLRPGRHFSEDLFIIYGLDPMVESPNYEIASLMMTAATYFAAVMAAHIISFIIVIIGYLEAQMSTLSIELTNIWGDSEKFYISFKNHNRFVVKDRARNIFVKKRLRDIIGFQILNINLRNRVEKELRCIFVIDFIFILLGLVTELVGGLENTLLQMPFTFSIVFVDCYIGQRLIDASTAFESAVYNCNWENFDVSNQRTVLFMLQCSQKTLTLSAGGMAVLSFPTLMSILRSTYSTYTTLKSYA